MCDAIGHPVTHLKRVAIGPIQDSRLKIGQWRELSEAEVRKLRAATEQVAGRPAQRQARPQKLRHTDKNLHHRGHGEHGGHREP